MKGRLYYLCPSQTFYSNFEIVCQCEGIPWLKSYPQTVTEPAGISSLGTNTASATQLGRPWTTCFTASILSGCCGYIWHNIQPWSNTAHNVIIGQNIWQPQLCVSLPLSIFLHPSLLIGEGVWNSGPPPLAMPMLLLRKSKLCSCEDKQWTGVIKFSNQLTRKPLSHLSNFLGNAREIFLYHTQNGQKKSARQIAQ